MQCPACKSTNITDDVDNSDPLGTKAYECEECGEQFWEDDPGVEDEDGG